MRALHVKTMSDLKRIEKILDEYHDQEWDLWYLGPCDEIANISRELSDKQWDAFIESTKKEKPDDWRVMLAHSFVEHHYGKSKSLVAFQVVKCRGYMGSYCALQYMQDLQGVPVWLKGALAEKINSMLIKAGEQDKVLLNNILNECLASM